MYVKFKDGTQFVLPKYPTSSDAVIAGHKRDTLSVTVEGEHSAVKAAFNGQPWAIHTTEPIENENGETVMVECEYDKSVYTLVASICDNMDGTITVRVGRANTVEETLQDEKNALAKQNAALTAENAEQADIINILAGGVTA